MTLDFELRKRKAMEVNTLTFELSSLSFLQFSLGRGNMLVFYTTFDRHVNTLQMCICFFLLLFQGCQGPLIETSALVLTPNSAPPYFSQDGSWSGSCGEKWRLQPAVRHLGRRHHLHRARRAAAAHVRPASHEVGSRLDLLTSRHFWSSLTLFYHVIPWLQLPSSLFPLPHSCD